MDLHPIAAQMHPSEEQKAAVLARDSDVVVTAGAGTGKTRTLVARYLSLLADGQELGAILAITFTRKAALEMRNRVRNQIRRYMNAPGLDEGERQVWRDRYRALDAARIGTIHSFCTELLRAHPAEASIDPRFKVLDEGQANILQSRAVEETLAWATDDKEVVGLFALLGEWDLRITLALLLARRLEAREALARLPADLLAHWQGTLVERQSRGLAVLLHSPSWEGAVEVLRESKAASVDDRMELQRQEVLAALDAPADCLAGRLSALSRLKAINLVGGSARAWPGGKEQLAAVKAALGELRALWVKHAALLALGLNPQDQALAGAIPALRALFHRAEAAYQQLKEERQALDFDDLEDDALALLQGSSAARARWQGEIRAILVDEFQDTNGRQRDLVRLLCDRPGKLFVVGDAKQSIYRFRGADVAVFRQERERITGQGGWHIRLDTSYRAHEALVEGLNDLLRPVLGQDEDPYRPWAEPFAPLGAHRCQPGPGIRAPYIELHLTAGTKGGGALDRAADALAGRILELVSGGLQVEDDGALRPLGYGDVAILCRASLSFGPYENALERAEVPFLTVAGRGFYDRPEIRDLLNALKALADPTDDLALAGLLRSPACALSDAALFHLCRAREQVAGGEPLWDLLWAGTCTLPPEDAQRSQRAARIIAGLHEQVGRTPVADILKGFLDATDYRAALIQTNQTRAARNISKLLADAHTSRIVGVGEFLEYLSGLRSAGAREGEARSTGEGAVQIMTIHAAKGLEFPVVAIGDVTGEPGGGRGDTLLIDPDLGPLLKLEDEGKHRPGAYDLARLQASDQENAEAARLLYVAATRAREKLILSGCVRPGKDNVLSSVGGYLGRLAGPDCLDLYDRTIPHDDSGAEAREFPLATGSTPLACTIYEPGHAWVLRARPSQAPARSLAPVPPPLLAPVEPLVEGVSPRLTDQDRIPQKKVWRVVPAVQRPRAPAWVVGSVVHEALAAWRFPASTEEHAFVRWTESRARALGLADPRQIGDAVRRCGQLLLRFRGDALYLEMHTAARRLHEVPYSLEVDGQMESGIIDALYQTAELWTIVEFKTDQVRDQAELDRLLDKEDYLAQTRRYLAATEQLLGCRPLIVLCLLNYAGTVHRHLLHTAVDT
jgi:ATP-dependent helicase/nuclease subunit A